jgi:hypothetical protein
MHFYGAPPGCAQAFGRVEWSFSFGTRHLFLSARGAPRKRDRATIIRPALRDWSMRVPIRVLIVRLEKGTIVGSERPDVKDSTCEHRAWRRSRTRAICDCRGCDPLPVWNWDWDWVWATQGPRKRRMGEVLLFATKLEKGRVPPPVDFCGGPSSSTFLAPWSFLGCDGFPTFWDRKRRAKMHENRQQQNGPDEGTIWRKMKRLIRKRSVVAIARSRFFKS